MSKIKRKRIKNELTPTAKTWAKKSVNRCRETVAARASTRSDCEREKRSDGLLAAISKNKCTMMRAQTTNDTESKRIEFKRKLAALAY